MRGALTQVYKHEADESAALDITSLAGLNHSLTSGTVDAFAVGTADKWNYLRESNIGSLLAIENVQTGLDEWSTTRPRLTGPAGEQRGAGHRLDSVAVDGASYLIEHDESGRITTALDHTLASALARASLYLVHPWTRTTNKAALSRPTTERRVAVDKEAKEYIVFDETNPGTGIFHGHTRPWSGGGSVTPLSQKMQSVLRKAGLVNKKGKIK